MLLVRHLKQKKHISLAFNLGYQQTTYDQFFLSLIGQFFRHQRDGLAALSTCYSQRGTWVSCQHPHGSLQLQPQFQGIQCSLSSGFQGHQTCTWYINRHAEKTPIYTIFFKKDKIRGTPRKPYQSLTGSWCFFFLIHTQTHPFHKLGTKPGPHRWKASALPLNNIPSLRLIFNSLHERKKSFFFLIISRTPLILVLIGRGKVDLLSWKPVWYTQQELVPV